MESSSFHIRLIAPLFNPKILERGLHRVPKHTYNCFLNLSFIKKN
jgi:hypothetical protein